MKNPILPLMMMASISTNTSAQVIFLENLVPTGEAAQLQGSEVVMKDDLLFVGGGDQELYSRNCNDWTLEHLFEAVGQEVAIGDDYLAAGGFFGNVIIYDKITPYAPVATLLQAYTAGSGNDEALVMAFAGNDLAVFSGSELRIYLEPYSTSNYVSLPPPTYGFAALCNVAADGDEVALISADGRALVYQRIAGIWGVAPVFVSEPLSTYSANASIHANGIALHDGVLMLSGGEYGGDGHVTIFNTPWNPSLHTDITVVSQSTYPSCRPALRVAFTQDYVFVSDGLGSGPEDQVLVYRDVNGTYTLVGTVNDDVGMTYGASAFGLAADDGYLAIGDPRSNFPQGSVNTYVVCGTDGTSCDSDCDPGTLEVWSDCDCVPAGECVQLVIEYGATPAFTEWIIAGVNHAGSWSGNEGMAVPNTDGVYWFNLPVGLQAAPFTYDIKVIAEYGGVDGWQLLTCDGRMIINSAGDWNPPSGSAGTASPGVLNINVQGAGDGCNQTMIDFGLPLGPATITSGCGVRRLRWIPNTDCGEPITTNPTNLYSLTAGGGTAPYTYQIFEPDGDVAIYKHDLTGCANSGPGNCQRTTTAANLSSWTSFHVRRGRWLNIRARDAGTNFGEVCYVCFEKRTGPEASWITCDELVKFAGGSENSLIVPTDYSSIELWPNPSQSGTVNLHIMDLDEAASIAMITVNDALGREVHRGQMATAGAAEMTTVLEVQDIVPGLYQVVVRSGERLFTARLVVE